MASNFTGLVRVMTVPTSENCCKNYVSSFYGEHLELPWPVVISPYTQRPLSSAGAPQTSYEKPPPGLIKEDETKPEDCIPDVPGNEHAREFLAHAPTKGLWMPLGKEVKVMQCWRCKRYGHRTGDKECPFFIKGNQKLEQFRVAHEDPMYDIIRENKRHEKDIRIQQLKQLLEDSTSDDDSSSSSSSECKERHKKRKKKEKHKKKKKEKKRKKKRKHKSSKSSESSDSD
ncbi:retinitis pigmentosa 9 protein homolog isoform X2 [Myotis lucifugus]|uniref:retinitis pigmentosa 9 protein homolog isoform X2 n=1 Tax=Myotis lucifugus TaxID=59463 RepID=UPI000CCC441D|nr:retinitis pigmentosa 9 protein homolog isoform X2 [Myotis lucifugus]